MTLESINSLQGELLGYNVTILIILGTFHYLFLLSIF